MEVEIAVLHIFLWWVMGFASALFCIAYISGEIAIKDVIGSIVCGVGGPLTLGVTLLMIGVEYWTNDSHSRVLWKRKY